MSKPCKHNWQFLRTAKFTETGSYQIGYNRVDTFFCTKCLEQQEKKQEQWSREAPAFYKD